jgi:hypothetical protein
MTTDLKTSPTAPAVIGTLLGVVYVLGMPVVFIAVEILAALALTGWLASGLWVIVGWNVWVFCLRSWQLAHVLTKGADCEDPA